MMDQSFMKTKPVLPLVVSMSMPMVLSMLVNALYNIVDSFFIARISEDAMTALSLVFPLQNIAGAVCIGFGVGVNAAVPQQLLRRDAAHQVRVAMAKPLSATRLPPTRASPRMAIIRSTLFTLSSMRME